MLPTTSPIKWDWLDLNWNFTLVPLVSSHSSRVKRWSTFQRSRCCPRGSEPQVKWAPLAPQLCYTPITSAHPPSLSFSLGAQLQLQQFPSPQSPGHSWSRFAAQVHVQGKLFKLSQNRKCAKSHQWLTWFKAHSPCLTFTLFRGWIATTCSKEGTNTFKELADSPQRFVNSPQRGGKGTKGQNPLSELKGSKVRSWPHSIPSSSALDKI